MLQKFILVFLIRTQNFTKAFLVLFFFLLSFFSLCCNHIRFFYLELILLLCLSFSLIIAFLLMTSKYLCILPFKQLLLLLLRCTDCQNSCSEFHAYSLNLPCIWKCAALHSKETYLFLKRAASSKVAGNTMTGMSSKDLAG